MHNFIPPTRFAGLAVLLLLAAAPASVLASATSASLASNLRPLSQYGTDFWNETSGLPQSRIRDIVQTRDGYLWLATDNGLVRFDGVAFTTFGVGTGSLRDNEIGCLTEDGEGALWIGTFGGGLTRHKDGRFTTFTTADGLPDDLIRLLDRDRDGNIWFTTPHGVCYYTGGKFITYTTRNGLSSNQMNALCARSRQGVFVGLNDKVFRFDGVRGGFVEAEDLKPRGEGFIDFLGAARDGSLVACYEKGVIKRLNHGVVTVSRLQGKISMRDAIACEDLPGTFWIGSREGLFRLNGERIEPLPLADLRARLGVVYSLCADREGSLWVGLEANGLARLRPIQFNTIGVENGLPEDRIRTIFQSARGDLWIGTSRGLVRYRDGVATTLDSPLPYHPLNVTALAEDREGKLWVGAGEDLFVLQGERFIAHPAWSGAGDIRVIWRDPAGPMWVGTNGAGLFRLDGTTSATFQLQEGLPHKQVRDVRRDRQGALWVATFGGGVCRLAGDTLTTFTEKDGLGGNRVVAIHAEADGALWFATRGGLSRFKDGRFRNFTARHGLSCTLAHSILDDGRGNLWFGSVQGLFKVAKGELDELAEGRLRQVRSEHYGTFEGMRTLACSAGTQPLAVRAADGRLLFSTLKGVAVIDPEDRISNPRMPPVHVEGVRINGRERPIAEGLTVPPGRGEVEIRYTALSFLSPDKVRFKYRLEGFDKEWIDAGTRRFAYYAGLPPGAYRFQVIACNNDGVWNENGAACAFELRPHFYQTRWFPLLCLIAATLLGLAIHKRRVRRLVAAERELQLRVDEALAKVKVLSGMLPICANCKKVRDDKGYWNSIEKYITEHSDTEISHGICPDCIKKLYPEMADNILSRMKAG